ncbi:hypothetical protein ACOME3_005120 [Neoechinorhynchus agilis]
MVHFVDDDNTQYSFTPVIVFTFLGFILQRYATSTPVITFDISQYLSQGLTIFGAVLLMANVIVIPLYYIAQAKAMLRVPKWIKILMGAGLLAGYLAASSYLCYPGNTSTGSALIAVRLGGCVICMLITSKYISFYKFCFESDKVPVIGFKHFIQETVIMV